MATNRVNNGNNVPQSTPLAGLATPTADTGKAKSAGKAAGANVNAGKNATPENYDVQISSDAKDRAEAYQKALGIARATPEVREDRVAALKKQIQDGAYQVDSGKIADGMLREAVKEHLAETDR